MGSLMQGVQNAQNRRQSEKSNRMEDETKRYAGSAYMGDPDAMKSLMSVNPQAGIQMQQMLAQRQAQQQQSRLATAGKMRGDIEGIMTNIAKFPDAESARSYAEEQFKDLQARHPEAMQNFSPEQLTYDEQDYTRAKILYGKGGNFASQQKFDYLAEKGGFTPDQVKKAAGIEAGLYPRATGSAAQTIASEGTANIIADTESTLAKGKETGKLEAQLDLKPKITAAVKLAEKAATEKGETFSDLSRMDAAMPGLVDTVGQLKELAMIATSTMGGKIFDAAVKETGFGATTGSTARAKFIAIINNQVLPLLKLTFGGSFSVQEGESLKATMGDPDASPAEKIAQLDAFIAQKERDIRAKRAEVSAPADTGILDQARAAIAGGADRQAVINRLKENGIDAGGL